MERIELEELKRLQLEILDNVHSFCINNKIDYWLDSGTLLGAIRHKGYIPWDDDIDIGMLRSDYNKFLSVFNDSNDKYKCYSIENNELFLYPFAKIIDTTTILYEPDEKGNKLGVNIDLFPYDKIPEEKHKAEKLYKRRIFFQKMRSLSSHNIHSGNKVKRFLIGFVSIFCKVFPKGYFEKKIVKNALSAYESSSHVIGNLTSSEVIFSNDSIFTSFIDVEFEGKKYKAPIGYDEWLRDFYGDYMVLPPIEKRNSNHHFVAYKNVNNACDTDQ